MKTTSMTSDDFCTALGKELRQIRETAGLSR
jgi:hypothetical protein